MVNQIGKIFKHFIVLAFCMIVVVTLVQVFMRYSVLPAEMGGGALEVYFCLGHYGLCGDRQR